MSGEAEAVSASPDSWFRALYGISLRHKHSVLNKR